MLTQNVTKFLTKLCDIFFYHYFPVFFPHFPLYRFRCKCSKGLQKKKKQKKVFFPNAINDNSCAND